MTTHTKKTDSNEAGANVDTTAALEHLDKAITALGLTTQNLTTKQRKAATRSRKRMEKVIPALALLSDQHAIAVPKEPTSGMTSGLALINQLEPVKQKLVYALSLVQDNQDVAGSASWNTASTLYGMLGKVAHRDSQLKSQLAPVKDFFGYRTKDSKKSHPKQKSKKLALKAEKEAAANAAATGPAPEPATTTAAPSAASAAASTTASNGASPSVVVSHA
jgi:hypothetical protein